MSDRTLDTFCDQMIQQFKKVKTADDVRKFPKYRVMKMVYDELKDMGLNKRTIVKYLGKIQIDVNEDGLSDDGVNKAKLKSLVHEFCRCIVLSHQTMNDDFGTEAVFDNMAEGLSLTIKN